MFNIFGMLDFPLCGVARLITTDRWSLSVLIFGKALEPMIIPLSMFPYQYKKKYIYAKLAPIIPCFKMTSSMFRTGVCHDKISVIL